MKTGRNRYEIEHIWANPLKHHADEFSHESEFEEYRNRIGGLLLLPKSINASSGDDPYAEKRKVYAGQNLLAQSLTEQAYRNNPGFIRFKENSGLLFHEHQEFKKADLDDRQKLYQQLAKRIWNPERLRVPHGEEPEITVDFDSDLHQGEIKEEMWTINRVRDLVPLEYREHYETQHKRKVGDIYARVAELQNLIEEKGWELILKFRKSYCALYVDSKPIFGINFDGSPRFAVWIPKEEAEELSSHCKFERYSEPHRHAIYPLSTSVDELLPIFESVYPQPDELDQLEEVAAKARQVLLDMGKTQEEIDKLLHE